MPPPPRGPEDLFMRIEHAIQHLEQIIEYTIEQLERTASWMWRITRQFLRLLFRGGWQVCRFAAVCLFLVYLTSFGVELLLAASDISLRFAAWPMRLLGALIVLSGLAFLIVLALACFTTPPVNPPEGETFNATVRGTEVPRRQRFTFSSPMPGLLLFVDIVICLILYGLLLWPPYRCQFFPLAATQQFMDQIVSRVTATLSPTTERTSPLRDNTRK